MGTLDELRKALMNITQEEYEQNKKNFLDYKARKIEGIKLKIEGLTKQLVSETKQELAQKMLDSKNLKEKLELLDSIAETCSKTKRYSTRRLPHEIKQDIEADFEEINKCIESRCFRSAVILCGRVLETALHRKYYETTGVDLLEKAPGTGLGTIIAKLSDKGVKLDPGLMNQIHLVNQIRVHSVHKKRESFSPSEQQARAILLYTTDILEKLF